MTPSENSETASIPEAKTRKGFFISGNVKFFTEVLVIIFCIGVGWSSLSSQQKHTTTELTRQYDVIKELITTRSDHEIRIKVVETKLDGFKEQMRDMKKLMEKISDKLDKR